MSAVGETLLTALALSGLAAFALALLPQAPARLRLALAASGLAAWLVPWGTLVVVVPQSGDAERPLVAWLGAAGDTTHLASEPLAAAGTAVAYVVAAAFAVGLALFASDCLALRRCVRTWREHSRPADELRALLPRELAAVAADIRLVENSAVAAASGVLRPTIWLGSRHAEADRSLVLMHELWHVRARDPLWLLAIAAVRRAYWWNPVVAHLARAAVLAIESACDERCAVQLGKAEYTTRLASLLLASTGRAARLVATVGTANLDVQRLRLLGTTLRLRPLDVLLIGGLAALGTATATAAVVESMPGPPAAALPSTPAGTALQTLLRATGRRDSELLAELLGAYTPQELPLPLPRAANVRIVEVLRDEPLHIEYVVESAGGARHVGELMVSPLETTTIAATALRPLPRPTAETRR